MAVAKPRLADDCKIMGTHPFVVPAKAGTHNHGARCQSKLGPQLLEKSTCGYGSRIGARFRSLVRDDETNSCATQLIRRQRNAIVDELIQRRLDVDVGVDHARLL
jgi:hypothetical protein